MLQYVNGFSCAMDSEKDELIIKLLQRSPDFTDDNGWSGNNCYGKGDSTTFIGRIKRNARRWGRLIVTIY